ncbi:hypothetical protein [Paraburkholderia caballeronis]|uniref:Uncharacterized protein n=1 Tax=Paraburkholderia caballeronis TaxID=416943 RepID=A0A1H7FAQ2_9BURK|nr:hypothetical protein [Paraburkholderia caballeronis]PXW23987.1 hypothetical protein C7403_108146 [Paraburkholderia caballeronis]PXW99751.1 hypothetical protein C7407_108146 [Paraburkholderia caballeronis]RAJ96705.1 hypothetical protein C7409_108146 [Paraburkholderia caballeronis]SEE76500.1 hypothetical protein SAMN05445871_6080 [Paraburkholderia caballeronis]SEK21462.1 hypothetical protein SAMN05192542_101186 [Paraburkholderia caballeronis]
MANPVLVKLTQDGRRVEVIDGWVCLAGVREADRLVPLAEHPNRQAIARSVPGATHAAGRLPLTHAEAAIAQGAMMAAQREFDASAAGIAQRIRLAVWAKTAADGVE